MKNCVCSKVETRLTSNTRIIIYYNLKILLFVINIQQCFTLEHSAEKLFIFLNYLFILLPNNTCHVLELISVPRKT